MLLGADIFKFLFSDREVLLQGIPVVSWGFLLSFLCKTVCLKETHCQDCGLLKHCIDVMGEGLEVSLLL